MLGPVQAWSRKQKLLILTTAVAALAAFAALIYTYERYYRGPTDSILVGTWEMTMPYGLDTATWVKLDPDHTAIWFSDGFGGHREDFRSSWFAAGPYIYMRYEGKRMIWQIIDIGTDELRLRLSNQDYIFKRSTREPPQAFNQAMQRTAGRSAFQLSMISTFQPAAARGLASGL